MSRLDELYTALTEVDDVDVFDCLVERLSDSEPDVVVCASSALGYLGDPRALEHLRPFLPGASPRLRGILEYSIQLLVK